MKKIFLEQQRPTPMATPHTNRQEANTSKLFPTALKTDANPMTRLHKATGSLLPNRSAIGPASILPTCVPRNTTPTNHAASLPAKI